MVLLLSGTGYPAGRPADHPTTSVMEVLNLSFFFQCCAVSPPHLMCGVPPSHYRFFLCSVPTLLAPCLENMCGVPPLLATCSENMCGVPPSWYTLFLCGVPPSPQFNFVPWTLWLCLGFWAKLRIWQVPACILECGTLAELVSVFFQMTKHLFSPEILA